MADHLNGFQLIIENSPDVTLRIDPNRCISYSSPATNTLFGYSKNELFGRDFTDFIHPEDRHSSCLRLDEILLSPSVPRRWDARVLCKDGMFCWVENTLIHALDGDLSAIVLNQRDIEGRKNEQDRSRLQAEQMVQLNLRMEEFAFTVAHDLREPLRAISIYSQMLREDIAAKDPEAAKIADGIVEGSLRMSTLVQDLLSLAKTGLSAPPHLVNLNEVANAALKSLALQLEECQAVVDLKSLPTIYIDGTHLVMLFQNLISNAIKYRRNHPVHIAISAAPRGPLWVVSVNDDGLGIDPKYQSQIFKSFVRFNAPGVPGTGLGLAVCKKIVEALQGTIWVESQPGVGSTFSFTLPSA